MYIQLFENFSNYKNLNKVVLDKVEKIWHLLVKRGSGVYTVKIEDDNKKFIPWYNEKEGKYFIEIKIKFDPGTYKAHAKQLKGDHRYIILIGTKFYSDLEKSKDDIFSTLAHEISHIAQHYNNFHEFSKDRHEQKWKDSKSTLKYQDWYSDVHHHSRETEKEAVMLGMFELIKRDRIDLAAKEFIYRSKYFDLYSLNKLKKKAYSYGIFKDFLPELKSEFTKQFEEYFNERIKTPQFYWDELFNKLQSLKYIFNLLRLDYKIYDNKLKEYYLEIRETKIREKRRNYLDNYFGLEEK